MTEVGLVYRVPYLSLELTRGIINAKSGVHIRDQPFSPRLHLASCSSLLPLLLKARYTVDQKLRPTSPYYPPARRP